MSALAPIQDIIADIKAGKMVILVDEEDRENEGDIVIAAEHITPEAINFMARHAREFLKSNPHIAREIENKIRVAVGLPEMAVIAPAAPTAAA